MTAYSYAAQTNRLRTVTRAGATQNVGYTAAGNINSFSPALNNVTSLTYNQAGRLASAASGSSTLLQYSYNAFGHRLDQLALLIAGVLEQLTWCWLAEELNVDASGVTVTFRGARILDLQLRVVPTRTRGCRAATMAVGSFIRRRASF
jgi:YD repeat-containing protein